MFRIPESSRNGTSACVGMCLGARSKHFPKFQRLRRGARVTIELGESEERVSESEEESVTIAGEEETYGSLLSGLSRCNISSLRLPKPNHFQDPQN